MAFWSRTRTVADVRPVHVPAPRGPVGSGTTELDRLADASFPDGTVEDQEEAWAALAAAFPDAGTEAEEHLGVVVARPLAGPDCAPILLFVTRTRLLAGGNLDRLVALDYARFQSVGRLSSGFPRLQVLLGGASPGERLEVGAYELTPNKWTGIFWRALRDAVLAARPDLPPCTTGAYEGLGVPAQVALDPA